MLRNYILIDNIIVATSKINFWENKNNFLKSIYKINVFRRSCISLRPIVVQRK